LAVSTIDKAAVVWESRTMSDHQAQSAGDGPEDAHQPLRLRGHHFLCILTYRGFGYTPAFVVNMTAKMAEIVAGRPVELVIGPDEICHGFTQACRAMSAHDCSLASTLDMDQAAIAALALLLPELQVGQSLILDTVRIAALRAAFADGSIRKACADCSWRHFCTAIAEEGFVGTKLFAPA
jgi:uncharacterized protein